MVKIFQSVRQGKKQALENFNHRIAGDGILLENQDGSKIECADVALYRAILSFTEGIFLFFSLTVL